jgi:hypothetical protein
MNSGRVGERIYSSDRVQREIHDLPRIRRDIGGQAGHQIAMKHRHTASVAGRSDNAAFFDRPRHGFFIQGPERHLAGQNRLVLLLSLYPDISLRENTR